MKGLNSYNKILNSCLSFFLLHLENNTHIFIPIQSFAENHTACLYIKKSNYCKVIENEEKYQRICP